MSDKKYREFWMMPDHPIGYDVVKPNGESIHVIEHQAYEQMKQERDAAHALIEEMAEALEKCQFAFMAAKITSVVPDNAMTEYRKWKGE